MSYVRNAWYAGASDRGVTLYNRLVAQLAAKETQMGGERGVSDGAA